MDKNSWLEVSLIVKGELAEAVSEVLARFAPNGVAIESTEIKAAPDEYGEPTGPLRVAAYLPIDDKIEENRQKLEESLYFLGLIQPLPKTEFKIIQDKNWMESWKKHFKPIRVGKKLLVLPAWIKNSDPERIPIKIDPGMAFGTGTHPTTQLSLLLLEEYLQPGDNIIDVGSGSGILSIAALKLGAKTAFGVDIELNAKAVATENAIINDIYEGYYFEIGSVEQVKDGIFPIRQAPIVIANILAHILIQLLDQGMGDLIAPDGILLLSGILDVMEEKLMAEIEKHGLFSVKRIQMDDWVGLAFRNK
ncbi:MAG: 50S ribosomal protein L11 methyltransferase [Chloroflexi bacterium]|nr:50S ribosomal protein L11 methyltransferase [Chloroflexota bacterium]MBT3668648.1 50S ribosomal protein L11 methyltransferase [Chloroflexota bacterium]MBT4002019.1 50S ribosomal protein L11 methyltransferase [Chloroflexota bacterium]MBT4304151.1 50S ribosomal protein L11 methyltransferase [Chloroflexota bacterium]MBT4533215.1 50S ribosomal protein L11 methyltransferase [Chloroflexota bacterium]